MTTDEILATPLTKVVANLQALVKPISGRLYQPISNVHDQIQDATSGYLNEMQLAIGSWTVRLKSPGELFEKFKELGYDTSIFSYNIEGRQNRPGRVYRTEVKFDKIDFKINTQRKIVCYEDTFGGYLNNLYYFKLLEIKANIAESVIQASAALAEAEKYYQATEADLKKFLESVKTPA